MGLISSLRTKVASKLLGELITEIGSAPANLSSRILTIAIRKRSDQPPHVQLKFAETGAVDYLELSCTPELAELLEKTSAEIRKQLG